MPDASEWRPAGRGGLPALRSWTLRQWATAATATLASVVLIAVPTDLIDTPWFGREVAPTAWAWPALLVSSALAGILVGTYVSSAQVNGHVPAGMPSGEAAADRADPTAPSDTASRGGWVGSALTFFAVGCPVCNKVVLLALGYSGAMRWFAPLQPILQAVGIALLAGAVLARLRSTESCAIPRARRVH